MSLGRQDIAKGALTLLLVLSFLLLIDAPAAGYSYHPRWYNPSLHFDGPDYLDGGEQTFPVQGSGVWGSSLYPRLMNYSRDFNLDGIIHIEDDQEMVVPFRIGTSVYGTTREWYEVSSTYPNNQAPAFY